MVVDRSPGQRGEPPPPGAFVLVLCRNVAIYFEPPAQQALHAKLAAALPLTGITLPFISYGGSSLVANFLLVALVWAMSARPRRVA